MDILSNGEMFSDDYNIEESKKFGPAVIEIQSKMVDAQDFDGEEGEKVNNMIENQNYTKIEFETKKQFMTYF